MIIDGHWIDEINENGDKHRYYEYTYIPNEEYFNNNIEHIPRLD